MTTPCKVGTHVVLTREFKLEELRPPLQVSRDIVSTPPGYRAPLLPPEECTPLLSNSWRLCITASMGCLLQRKRCAAAAWPGLVWFSVVFFCLYPAFQVDTMNEVLFCAGYTHLTNFKIFKKSVFLASRRTGSPTTLVYSFLLFVRVPYIPLVHLLF